MDKSTASSTASAVIALEDGEDTYVTLARSANDETARAHPLYQASLQNDDMYHCPFETEDCGHKPTKLKCNYEYVRSPD